jgi:hypothetical protein
MTDLIIQDERVAQLEKQLRGAQETYEGAKATFMERFEKTPVYAFEWADTVMSAAVTAKLHNEFADSIIANQEGDKPLSYEEIIAFITRDLTDRVLRGAESPKQSTSSTQNLLAQFELSAAAKLLKRITTFWSQSATYG